MEIILTIIAAVLVLSLLILVHELGHFWMAKRAGIKVEEFGMGLPPRIWGKKKGETIYSINAIPFGGFVRMYGEDQADAKMAKSKRSFASKSVAERVSVIVAGVVMNFLLAVVLLAIGFGVGMKPLLTPEEVPTLIANGGIVLESGLTVEEDGGGLKAGDVIKEVNGELLDSFVLSEALSNEGEVNLAVWQGGERRDVLMKGSDLKEVGFKDGSSFPRLMVRELGDSLWAKGGVEVGDIILRIGEEEVVNFAQLERGLIYNMTVYRDGETLGLKLPTASLPGILVARVLADSPAEKAGLLPGDIIEYVDGEQFFDSQLLIEKVRANGELPYIVKRGDQALFMRIGPNEDQRIGVILNNLYSLSSEEEVQLVETDLFSTVVEIKELKEPWYFAPVAGFKEAVRLSGMTFKMMLGVFGDIFQGNGVPEGVSGPIGIAKMTYGFVQEGVIALLQFVAILSLSLAVINILPIPALDGGRLLFIIFEVILGRKINQKIEGYIHGVGYLLLLGLILLVTLNDIGNL